MTFILAIIVFGLLILVHELGHFITAKLCGATVTGFSVGFGPAILKKESKGTLYALRAFPIGGYVSMLDTSGDPEGAEGMTEEQLKGDFDKLHPLKRIAICFAGSFMNFVAGILILVILFSPAQACVDTRLSDFMDGFGYESPAYFMKGDRLVDINGFHIYTHNDIGTALAFYGDEEMTFTLERSGKRVKVGPIELRRELYSEDDPDNPKIGFIFGYRELGFFGRVGYACDNAMSFLQNAVKSIGFLLSSKAKTSDMMGTIGIASEISERARESMTEMWYFVAYIAVNLAFVNMLPIPGLDGSKILGTAVEWVTGKKLSPGLKSAVTAIGFAAIIGLFLFSTYNDIVRLFVK